MRKSGGKKGKKKKKKRKEKKLTEASGKGTLSFMRRFFVSTGSVSAAATLCFVYNAKTSPYIASTDKPTSAVRREEISNIIARPPSQGILLDCLSSLAGRVDTVYALCAGYGRGMLHFKTGGWGNMETVKRCGNAIKQSAAELTSPSTREEQIRDWLRKDEIQWDGDWEEDSKARGVWKRDGSFVTPMFRLFGDEKTRQMIDEPSERAYFRYVVPSQEKPSFDVGVGSAVAALSDGVKSSEPTPKPHNTPALAAQGKCSNSIQQIPLVMHLPCAGDQGFLWRDRHFATPLAQDNGIASLILESPTYGKRRLADRPVRGAYVDRVADLCTVGLVQIVESLSLLSWMKQYNPCHQSGHFGVCGISMGAEIATLFATVSPLPCNVVAVMPSHSAVATWSVGVMQYVADWKHLANVMPKEALSHTRKNNFSARDAQDHAAKWLEHTDIRTYPLPYKWLDNRVRPKIILVGAVDDQYIPHQSVSTLAAHWKGMCSLRWIAGGHCTGVVFHKDTVRGCIVDSMSKDVPSSD